MLACTAYFPVSERATAVLKLESDKIPTATGKTEWHATVIDKMLSNEKYMGDALLQKTYTVNFLSKKKVINKGIVPQYYVEDDDEPIIPKELFYRVQEEKARRSSIYTPAAKRKDSGAKIRYSSTYALSDILVCGECGHPYRRQVWSKYGIKKAVWRCDSRLKNGTKVCNQKYRAIADEIKDLKKKKRKRLREKQLADAYEKRLEGLDDYMKKTSYLKRQFDDDLVRRLIQSIKVISVSKIEIQFKSEIVMRQDILCDE